MRLSILSVVAVLCLFILNSCVVWKFDTLLTERNRNDVPKLSGKYVDEKGQSVTFKPSEFTNTFIVTPSSGKAPVRVTMENIGPKRYLVQGALTEIGQGLPTYALTVAEIDGKKITLYFFLGLDARLYDLAQKHNVKYELFGFKEDQKTDKVTSAMGVITAYDSVDGVIGFFNDLFSIEEAQKLVFTKK
jgi:hypothetical protein